MSSFAVSGVDKETAEPDRALYVYPPPRYTDRLQCGEYRIPVCVRVPIYDSHMYPVRAVNDVRLYV